MHKIEADSWQGLRTLVVGLGVTGLSCARYLIRHGVDVAVTDSRAEPPALQTLQHELPDVALFAGGLSAEAFARAERIVVSPGVSLQEPLLREARQRGIEIIGDIELFARAVTAPVIGITGSNGKSTVTMLLGAMAQRAGIEVRVGGNIGTPALDLLLEHEADLYVLELSSFQLETVSSLKCKAAAVLNISPDHLDRHETLDAYLAAKLAVYRGARIEVVNLDDPLASGLGIATTQRTGFTMGQPQENGFGITGGVNASIAQGSERWMPVSEIRMKGGHNVANALAALALGVACDLPKQPMLEVLREFEGLPHRTQWVGSYQGVNWVNDSKATNIGAALAAVRGFSEPLVLIAGGQAKGADMRELADGIYAHVKAVVLLGEAAKEIASALRGRLPVEMVSSMQEAVRVAAQIAEMGDTVLLSPACASFDQFNGYADRGQVFMKAVQGLSS